MNKVLLSLSIVAAFTACKQSQQKNENRNWCQEEKKKGQTSC